MSLVFIENCSYEKNKSIVVKASNRYPVAKFSIARIYANAAKEQ